jgi:hypothetical protein
MPSFSVLWNEGFLFGAAETLKTVRPGSLARFNVSRFNASTNPLHPLWSLNQTPSRNFLRDAIERSVMKKVCLLAIAGLFVTSTLHASFVVHEKFATDPALDGWQVFGDTNLFQWDSTNQVLDVTWDSTQTNSYYYHLLDRTYTVADSFYVQFDLQLNDAVSFNSGQELAIGLLHFSDATDPDFSRPNTPSPNLCEFDYFPAYTYDGTPYPSSADATVVDSGGNYFFAYDNVTLLPGGTYRVVLIHQAGAEAVSGVIYTNGQVVTTLPSVYDGGIGDFQLDMLSVINYADDGYGDDILAHGTVGNLAFASPLPLGFIQAPMPGQVQTLSDTNWVYTLEQSVDLQTWTPAALPVPGNGTNLVLQATNPPSDHAFYQIRADLP